MKIEWYQLQSKTRENVRKFFEDRKNLLSVIIVLLGLFVGSLFIDLGQLITGTGFSGPVIRTHDVLVTGGKTWVGYSEPKVSLRVLSDDTCIECDPSEALLWLRRIVPTIEAERIDVSLASGQALADSFGLVSVPAFVFGPEVKETEFFAQAEPLFRESNNALVFDMNKIGMPIGRYLVAPETGEDDITIGSTDAPITLVVFSDFQCEYCKEYHAAYKQALKEYGDRIRLVWKHFPLPIHREASKAAEAAQCADDQGQFMAYADILFERQSEWGKLGGEQRLKDYAWRIKGMDARAFIACLDGGSKAEKVAADVKLAESFNLESAPASFLGREFISGAAPYEDLKALIETGLAEEPTAN